MNTYDDLTYNEEEHILVPDLLPTVVWELQQMLLLLLQTSS